MARQINARVFLKHETEENWNKAENFIPQNGEVIIYDPDSNNNMPRFKIGNGIDIPKNLPFQSIGAQIIVWEDED